MSAFRKFGRGFAASVLGASLFGVSTVVLCDSRASSKANISEDGLSNRLFDNDTLPTKAELEYVKTWGVPWVEDWDRPGSRGISGTGNGGGSRQIILIRHGQYENESVRDDSVRRLTSLGEDQARRTGRYLHAAFESAKRQEAARAARLSVKEALVAAKASGDSEKIAQLERDLVRAKVAEKTQGGFFVNSSPRFVHVSDMTRARQTADFILEAFPSGVRQRLAVDDKLRERFPCDPEPRYRRASAAASDMKIAEDVFEKYFHRPDTNENTVEIIVGHANVIRYLTLRALQLPPEAWLRTSLPHCSITNLVINSQGRVKLAGMGSFGHLPPDMVTVHNIS